MKLDDGADTRSPTFWDAAIEGAFSRVTRVAGVSPAMVFSLCPSIFGGSRGLGLVGGISGSVFSGGRRPFPVACSPDPCASVLQEMHSEESPQTSCPLPSISRGDHSFPRPAQVR